MKVVDQGPHRIEITETGELGINSGRPRYRVECKTCDVVVHESTTGPDIRVRQHLEGERLS